MVIVFADNQAMTSISGTPSIIFTDPMPLGGNDRATANFGVHYIWNSAASTTTIAYKAQVSNDGTNWVDVNSLADSTTAVTGSTPLPKSGIAIYGAYIRFFFTLTVAGGGSTLGGVCLDLHVLLDKS